MISSRVNTSKKTHVTHNECLLCATRYSHLLRWILRCFPRLRDSEGCLEWITRTGGHIKDEHGSRCVVSRDNYILNRFVSPYRGHQRLTSLRVIHLLSETRNTDFWHFSKKRKQMSPFSSSERKICVFTDISVCGSNATDKMKNVLVYDYEPKAKEFEKTRHTRRTGKVETRASLEPRREGKCETPQNWRSYLYDSWNPFDLREWKQRQSF